MTHQIYAVIQSLPCPNQGEAQASECVRDNVFEVGADIDCCVRFEASPLSIIKERRHGIVKFGSWAFGELWYIYGRGGSGRGGEDAAEDVRRCSRVPVKEWYEFGPWSAIDAEHYWL